MKHFPEHPKQIAEKMKQNPAQLNQLAGRLTTEN